MFPEHNEYNNIDVPKEYVEIARQIKLNRILMQKRMLKLLYQNFNENCEKSKQELMEIMEYVISSEGKYYRSFFVNILGEALGVNKARTFFTGSIIEMLHSYILMQSAIPDIENNDYRYNQESCHRKFGVDKTIIASSALITLIMEMITSSDSVKISSNTRCELIKIIAKYSGKDGISGGQMMRILLKKKNKCTQDEVNRIKKLKINSLFSAGAECIELLADTTDEQNIAIKNYINNFCNLINLYEELDEKCKNSKELLKRAKLLMSQGCASISKIPNNEKLVSFIKYNNFCLEKLIEYSNSNKPIVVESDIARV